jgi:hypothetical protein
MKRVIFLSLAVIFLVSMAVPAASAKASAAADLTWQSNIQYFNPGTDSGTLTVTYYQTDGTTVPGGDIALVAHQSGNILIGSTFTGSAVVGSTIPVMAVYKQAADIGNTYSPILSTSFDLSMVGEGKFFVPSVLLTDAFESQVGVQNIEGDNINVTLNFYDMAGMLYTSGPYTVKTGASYIFKASEISGLPNPFDGSLVITAAFTTGGAPARIVASVQDLQNGGQKAYAFEGSAAVDSNMIFMPTAACKYKSDSTTFAVQNAGASPADVVVDYYTTAGKKITKVVQGATIPVGAKAVFNTCDKTIMKRVKGKALTAVIYSTNSQPLAAVGFVNNASKWTSAYVGQVAPGAGGDGKYRVALPYVEWQKAANNWRSYITVMNVGTATATTKLYYYKNDGTLARKAAQSIKVKKYAKGATDPSKAKALVTKKKDPAKSTMSGAVIIESTQPIVALVRVQKKVGSRLLGDDYNGMVYAP